MYLSPFLTATPPAGGRYQTIVVQHDSTVSPASLQSLVIDAIYNAFDSLGGAGIGGFASYSSSNNSGKYWVTNDGFAPGPDGGFALAYPSLAVSQAEFDQGFMVQATGCIPDSNLDYGLSETMAEVVNLESMYQSGSWYDAHLFGLFNHSFFPHQVWILEANGGVPPSLYPTIVGGEICGQFVVALCTACRRTRSGAGKRCNMAAAPSQ